jgi:AcrR family transcriptional regulator
MAKRNRAAAPRLTASARRTQLIETARAVFAKRGYEATSMEEIAAKAKVSKPIVYEHFGGKEGLYAVLVDREMDYVVSRIAEAIGTGTPRQRVERAAMAFLSYVRDQPDGFVVLSRDAPVALAAGGMSSLLNDVAERVADVFTSTFRKAGYDPKTAPIYAHAWSAWSPSWANGGRRRGSRPSRTWRATWRPSRGWDFDICRSALASRRRHESVDRSPGPPLLRRRPAPRAARLAPRPRPRALGTPSRTVPASGRSRATTTSWRCRATRPPSRRTRAARCSPTRRRSSWPACGS